MIEYLRRVLNPKTGRLTDIKVQDMRMEDATFWHQYIQPTIRAISPSRADRMWNWPTFLTYLPRGQYLAGRRCRALTIHLEASNRAIPAGMLLLIESYPWWAPSPWRRLAFWRTNTYVRCSFTWFLSTAPRDTLIDLGVPEPPSLGRVLIDTALVTSVALGHGGRMWLHASPIGGERLSDFYRTAGLAAIQVGQRVPHLKNPLAGVPSDGRHFYADPPIAKRLTEALNTLR
jgi:hypothetical protein